MQTNPIHLSYLMMSSFADSSKTVRKKTGLLKSCSATVIPLILLSIECPGRLEAPFFITTEEEIIFMCSPCGLRLVIKDESYQDTSVSSHFKGDHSEQRDVPGLTL